MAKSLFECKRILNVKAASLGLPLVAPPPPPPPPAPAQMSAISIKSKCEKRKYACAPAESTDADKFLKCHTNVIDELETVLKYGIPKKPSLYDFTYIRSVLFYRKRRKFE